MTGMTARMRAAIAEGQPAAILFYVDHPDGVVRGWSGVGTLDHDGEEWLGLGRLVSIAPLETTGEIAIQSVAFVLSGVPPEDTTWLSANVRERPARAWLALFDAAGRVVPDPWLLVDGVMDYQEISVGEDGLATIRVTVLAGFWTLERAADEAWTTEEQKQTWPTDVGLDLIPALQNKTVRWTLT